MGDFSASECSWKKMVIAKSNNKWISTIRSEDTTLNMNTSNLSIDVENIKKELDDDSKIKNRDENEADTYIPDVDPLVINTTPKKVRRKSSASKNETPEERAARLAKMSAYAAKRLANETPEQRALRLKRMSEYAAKRLAEESSEQRARRLARMSAYSAKRLANESPEQRQARLIRMSAYAARRQAMKKIVHADPDNTYMLPYSTGEPNNMSQSKSESGDYQIYDTN